MISIYEFQTPQNFLQAWLKNKQEENPHFSLRSWAKKLGYKSPSTLSKVLRSERPVSPKVAKRVLETINLSLKEQRYFQLLVLLDGAKSTEEKSLISDLIRSAFPNVHFKNIALDRFRAIADWYHLAIFESLNLDPCPQTDEDFAELLGISIQQARESISRLERLGLIFKDSGRWQRKPDFSISVGEDIPDDAVCEYHRQVTHLALKSIEKQKFGDRELVASTHVFAKEDIPKAKAIINQCHDQLLALSQGKAGSSLYQCNSQFFLLNSSTERSTS